MIYKETSKSGELYVYINGEFVYKRWPNGSSIVVEKYGAPTWNSERNPKCDQ